jgi:hypothetical protein
MHIKIFIYSFSTGLQSIKENIKYIRIIKAAIIKPGITYDNYLLSIISLNLFSILFL